MTKWHVPKFHIMSHQRAEEVIAAKKQWPAFDAILSIGDPGTPPPKGYKFIPLCHTLHFEDEAPEEDGFGGYDFLGNIVYPNKRHISSVISFARKVSKTKLENVLIHCWLGINRSTAAGYIILSHLLGEGEEEEAMQIMLDSCCEEDPDPNDYMIELADEILHRDGKMMDIWEDFFATN